MNFRILNFFFLLLGILLLSAAAMNLLLNERFAKRVLIRVKISTSALNRKEQVVISSSGLMPMRKMAPPLLHRNNILFGLI